MAGGLKEVKNWVRFLVTLVLVLVFFQSRRRSARHRVAESWSVDMPPSVALCRPLSPSVALCHTKGLFQTRKGCFRNEREKGEEGETTREEGEGGAGGDKETKTNALTWKPGRDRKSVV